MEKYKSVPDGLKQRKTWVHYRIIERGGRTTKVPYRIDGAFASSVNPDDWSGFEKAVEALENSSADGLGIVLCDGLVGVDLDHVLSDEKKDGYIRSKLLDKYILADALAIVHALDSYTEISPSGDGLHILCFGSLPAGGSRKGFVEMYEKGRYFTFTGNTLPEHNEVMERTEILAEIHKSFIGGQEEKQRVPVRVSTHSQLKDELLEQAFKSANGDKIRALYEGSISGYNSPSEADLALLSHLAFWTDKDEARMDAIFRTSRLMRPKWDEKRGAETYGERIIRIACEKCSETYSPMKQAQPKKIPAIEAKDVLQLLETDIPPINWIIHDVLPSGLAILASPPKYGKSWMVLDLCISLACGSRFMNWDTEPCRTIYFALEDSDRRLKERITKVLGGRSLPEGFKYATRAESLENGFAVSLDRYLAENPKTKLVVIDTLQKIRGSSNEQVYSADYRDMSALKEVADKHNVCVLLIHHLRKSSDDTDAFNRISGSNGIFGAVDTAWVLTRESRGSKNTKLSVTGRDVTQSEMVLWFSETDCKWHCNGSAEQIARKEEIEEYNCDPLVMEILDIVEDAGGKWVGRTTELHNALSESMRSEISSVGLGIRLRKMAANLLEFSSVSFTPPARHGGDMVIQRLKM